MLAVIMPKVKFMSISLPVSYLEQFIVLTALYGTTPKKNI